MGLVDVEGCTGYGIFLKASRLLRGMRAVFLAEMRRQRGDGTECQEHEVYNSIEMGMESSADEGAEWQDIMENISADPWLSDIFGSWFRD